MPPRKQAEQPSVVDQLADDALPDEYPEGAPELRPYLHLQPRSRRAEFKRQFAAVIERYEHLNEIRKRLDRLKNDPPKSEQMRLMADMDELYQSVDDLLRLVAVDSEKYDAWSAEASDADLMQTFAVYQQRSQPGEAPSSAS